MTTEERADFDRQLKGVQNLAKHFRTTISGLQWRDGLLTGRFVSKGDPVEPKSEEPVFVAVEPKRKRSTPTQLGLL